MEPQPPGVIKVQISVAAEDTKFKEVVKRRSRGHEVVEVSDFVFRRKRKAPAPPPGAPPPAKAATPSAKAAATPRGRSPAAVRPGLQLDPASPAPAPSPAGGADDDAAMTDQAAPCADADAAPPCADAAPPAPDVPAADPAALRFSVLPSELCDLAEWVFVCEAKKLPGATAESARAAAGAFREQVGTALAARREAGEAGEAGEQAADGGAPALLASHASVLPYLVEKKKAELRDKRDSLLQEEAEWLALRRQYDALGGAEEARGAEAGGAEQGAAAQAAPGDEQGAAGAKQPAVAEAAPGAAEQPAPAEAPTGLEQPAGEPAAEGEPAAAGPPGPMTAAQDSSLRSAELKVEALVALVSKVEHLLSAAEAASRSLQAVCGGVPSRLAERRARAAGGRALASMAAAGAGSGGGLWVADPGQLLRTRAQARDLAAFEAQQRRAAAVTELGLAAFQRWGGAAAPELLAAGRADGGFTPEAATLRLLPEFVAAAAHGLALLLAERAGGRESQPVTAGMVLELLLVPGVHLRCARLAPADRTTLERRLADAGTAKVLGESCAHLAAALTPQRPAAGERGVFAELGELAAAVLTAWSLVAADMLLDSEHLAFLTFAVVAAAAHREHVQQGRPGAPPHAARLLEALGLAGWAPPAELGGAGLEGEATARAGAACLQEALHAAAGAFTAHLGSATSEQAHVRDQAAAVWVNVTTLAANAAAVAAHSTSMAFGQREMLARHPAAATAALEAALRVSATAAPHAGVSLHLFPGRLLIAGAATGSSLPSPQLASLLFSAFKVAVEQAGSAGVSLACAADAAAAAAAAPGLAGAWYGSGDAPGGGGGGYDELAPWLVLAARPLAAAGRLLQLPAEHLATAPEEDFGCTLAADDLESFQEAAAWLGASLTHLAEAGAAPAAAAAAAAESGASGQRGRAGLAARLLPPPVLESLLEQQAAVCAELAAAKQRWLDASQGGKPRGILAQQLAALRTAAGPQLAAQLQAFGEAVCAALPLRSACSNPRCANVSGLSEALLARGSARAATRTRVRVRGLPRGARVRAGLPGRLLAGGAQGHLPAAAQHCGRRRRRERWPTAGHGGGGAGRLIMMLRDVTRARAS
ncbi:hypothetical protein HT031_003096 [Scenedesmus sp. PABB004]|nr:hypothetical protein HT031_003096 [Scenedesmus sp. PABB004]